MVVNRRRPVTIYEVYDEDPDAAPRREARPRSPPSTRPSRCSTPATSTGRAPPSNDAAQLLPDDPVAPLHLAHCDAVARGEMSPGQEVALLQK